jgi:hypothetical protein
MLNRGTSPPYGAGPVDFSLLIGVEEILAEMVAQRRTAEFAAAPATRGFA